MQGYFKVNVSGALMNKGYDPVKLFGTEAALRLSRREKVSRDVLERICRLLGVREEEIVRET